jgi:hypothetical protein
MQQPVGVRLPQETFRTQEDIFPMPGGTSRRAFLAGLALSLAAAPRLAAVAQTRTPILDAHIHIARQLRAGENIEGMAALALEEMDSFGIEKAILGEAPLTATLRRTYSLSQVIAVVQRQPRFGFTAGGDVLNSMLQETPAAPITDEVQRRFTDAAELIASAGAAGFGELAAEHFSSGRGQMPYESSPPDHPLLLALADIAARHSMPLELHMEAVPRDMPTPPRSARPPNPSSLHENISAFERLLDHNTSARIVWVHAGWDITGQRTVRLMRGLLGRHRNLFMTIKYDHIGTKLTAPFSSDSGGIRPGWIALLRDFPDRFMIGSDQFIGDDTERFAGARRVVEALPADLARPIANENVKRIYRLGVAASVVAFPGTPSTSNANVAGVRRHKL